MTPSKTTAALACAAAALILSSGPARAAVWWDNIDGWIDKHALCFGCHDSKADMKQWLLDNKAEVEKLPSLAKLIHAEHLRNGKPVGNCLMCHGDAPQAFWKIEPDKANCAVCHPIETLPSHANIEKREQCQACHSAKQVGDAHTARFKREAKQAQRAIVKTDVESAKLIEKADGLYADVTLRLRDVRGVAIRADEAVREGWIESLRFYVNAGTAAGMTQGRAEKVDVLKTADLSGGDLRFTAGPIAAGDAGALAREGRGVFELVYCFDDNAKLMACGKDAKKNAAYNTFVRFTADGLKDPLRSPEPKIVTNETCGNCHGYDKKADTTQIACGSCHNDATAAKKAAGTRDFSGTDGKAVFAKRTYTLDDLSVKSFTSSLTDVESCGLCHNAKTAPTAAVRNRLVDKNDPHYLDSLLLSHPDMKVFAHALHANLRPGQMPEESVRYVAYPSHVQNCTKCHAGPTYSLDRLAHLEKAEPLALDTAYSADSSSTRALDFKADRYASPMAAACWSCHAKTTDAKGNQVWNDKAKQHILDMGGVLAGKKDEIRPENCAACHTADSIAKAHGLKK